MSSQPKSNALRVKFARSGMYQYHDTDTANRYPISIHNALGFIPSILLTNRVRD